ncbi:hypothetical protein ACJMK2_018433 [Sinanodonta woodiana]|uniref:Uncharacterized protein n=1 Tax=Sinanodonta woodiana TaxID=1069815 RepID=A0ABD3UGH9_SINWO
MEITKRIIIVKQTTPMLRKLKKKTVELGVSDIPLKILLEARVKYFEEKFTDKAILSRMATIPAILVG